MLDRVQWPLRGEHEFAPEAHLAQRPALGVPEIWGALLRQWKVIIGIILACTFLSVAVLLILPIRYAAVAQVMIDPLRPEPGQSSGLVERQVDSGAVDTQVEVGRSGNVLRRVVTALSLTDDSEFGAFQKSADVELGWLEQLKEQLPVAIGLSDVIVDSTKTNQDPIQATVEKLRRSLSVRRVGATNVIEIEARSRDQVKAASVANTLAEEYLADQVRARNEAIEKASMWLDERLVAIRSEAQRAEDALQEFRAKNKSSFSSATLLELETQAQSYRKLYENFLDRHISADQQISFPIRSARVITQATPPHRKSEPKTLLTLAAGLGLGTMLGIAVGLARERFSCRFRSAHDVVSALGVPCLGSIPVVERMDFNSLCDLQVRDHYTESNLQTVRLQTEVARLTLALTVEANAYERRVLAITSSKRGEGVTSLACAVAYSIARLGKKVLLIDANLQVPQLTHDMARKTAYAQVSGSLDGQLLSKFYSTDGEGPLFAPADTVSKASDLETAVSSARIAFDYIIIDAPALENGPAILPSVTCSDAVILLINAPTSRKQDVVNELASWTSMNGRVLGVILNRTSTKLQQGKLR